MNALITASLTEANVQHLFGFPRELLGDTEKKTLEWIVQYTSRYGKPPTVERLEQEFATFVRRATPDPLGDVYDSTLTRKRNHYARKYLMNIQDQLKKGADPLPFISELHQTIRHGSGNVSRYTTYDRSAYHRQPTSFQYEIGLLDKYTGGIAKGDLIYLIGRLGTGKTTFALWLISKWLQRDRRMLLVSNENRADDVIAKIDSYIGGFNPIKKRTQEWTQSDLHRLNTVSFIARNMQGEVFVPNQPVQDVEELQGLVYTYRPDLVIVDGIYLMQGAQGDSHWEKITGISRKLKQLADAEGVPVVGIHQANRQAIGKRIEIEHIAYADALAQDADLVLGLNAEDDGNLFVEGIKNRWGTKEGWGFFVKFFFDTMTARVLDGKLTLKESV